VLYDDHIYTRRSTSNTPTDLVVDVEEQKHTGRILAVSIYGVYAKPYIILRFCTGQSGKESNRGTFIILKQGKQNIFGLSQIWQLSSVHEEAMATDVYCFGLSATSQGNCNSEFILVVP